MAIWKPTGILGYRGKQVIILNKKPIKAWRNQRTLNFITIEPPTRKGDWYNVLLWNKNSSFNKTILSAPNKIKAMKVARYYMKKLR